MNRKPLAWAIAAAALTLQNLEAATVAVDTTVHRQRMIGFGGALVYNNLLSRSANSKALYDTLFTGLGLSVLRVGNWFQDSTDDLGAWTHRWTRQVVDDSIVVAEARKRLPGVKILQSSWTPPAHLKSGPQIPSKNHSLSWISANSRFLLNDSALNGGTLRKINGAYNYAGFARWWRISLERSERLGFLPDMISIQNEPDVNAEYGGCVFDSTENARHAGYDKAFKAVFDTLRRTHPSWATRLAGPEVLGIGGGSPLPFVRALKRLDPNMVDGHIFHLYTGNGADWNQKYRFPDAFTSAYAALAAGLNDGKWRMATEFAKYGDPTPDDLMSLGRILHGAVTGPAELNGYIAWQLINQGDGDHFLNVGTGRIGPSYHALRHFSRFTRSGWHRVQAVSSDTSVRVVAFASPASDTVTVVALNVGTTTATYTTGKPLPAALELWQSVVGGALGKRLALASGATSIALPPQSITTYQYSRPRNSAPAISMACPTTPLKAPATLTCTWKASDAIGGLRLIEMLQNGVGVNYLPRSDAPSNASGTFTVSNLPWGSHQFQPKATDALGAVTYGPKVVVRVDWNYALTTSGTANWFGGLTIGYALPPTTTSASAELLNSSGTVIKTIVLSAGSTRSRFTSLSGRPAGTYTVRLVVDGMVQATRSVLKL